MNECATAWQCRAATKRAVEQDCLGMVRELGDAFGRDRVRVVTVAFGPREDDYRCAVTKPRQ